MYIYFILFDVCNVPIIILQLKEFVLLHELQKTNSYLQKFRNP